MMNDLSKEANTYFEIAGFGVDEEGNPCPAGAKLGVSFNPDASKEQIIAFVANLLHIDPSRITMISKERYDAEYKDDEEEYDPDWEED